MKDISTLPNMDAATGNRIDGEMRDDVVPGDNSGTPVREDWEQDDHYAHIAVMNRAGIAADGSEEGATASQVLEAHEKILDGIDDRVIDVTSNKTIIATEQVDTYSVDTASGSVVITLPDRASVNGKRIRVAYTQQTSANIVTVTRAGADTITGDGLTSIILPKEQNYIEIYADSNSARWEIINENISTQLRLDTFAGYGSTDNKIMQFTNETEDYGNMFSNNHGSYGTDGLEITVNKAGKYSFSFYCVSRTAGNDWPTGLSLNSSQLTTDIQNITVADRLATMQNGAALTGNTTWIGKLDSGDIVRPHTFGNTPDAAAICGITVTYLGP